MQPTEPWYTTLFSGLFLDAQRRMFTEEQTRAEAAFLKDALSLTAGERVLDVPCGNGRLSVALAAAGCDVTGVDLTGELLDDARRAAQDRKVPATFERRDMRDLPWESHFDAAFCFGNSFAYFDEAGNEAFLRAVHRSLKPAGRFALQTSLLAEVLYPMPQARRWYPMGDLFFLHETSGDPFTGRQTSNYVLIRDGRVERGQAVYQLYTLRELLRLVAAAGFTDVQVFGSLQREPFQLGSSGAWLVMRRGEAG